MNSAGNMVTAAAIFHPVVPWRMTLTRQRFAPMVRSAAIARTTEYCSLASVTFWNRRAYNIQKNPNAKRHRKSIAFIGGVPARGHRCGWFTVDQESIPGDLLYHIDARWRRTFRRGKVSPESARSDSNRRSPAPKAGGVPLSYAPESQAANREKERPTGIEPALPTWQAGRLPLQHGRLLEAMERLRDRGMERRTDQHWNCWTSRISKWDQTDLNRHLLG